MILRNKKTGEIVDVLISAYGISGDVAVSVMDGSTESGYRDLGRYKTLTELNDEWEDYIPAEPLIKDEKIREAVRSWARTNNIDTTGIKVSKGSNTTAIIGWVEGRFGGLSIDFQAYMLKELEDGKKYTLVELCGEEK